MSYNKMSKLFLALLAGVLLVCCGKMPGKDSTVKALFSAVWSESGTRAAGAASGENVVGTLDVLVFDTHGNLITSGHNPSGSTLALDVPRGSARCYAVANAHSDLSAVVSESELLSVRSALVDNAPSDFEMMGSRDYTFVGNDAVDITLDRYAVKVALDGIELSLADPSWAASGVGSIDITGIYLTNVVSQCDYALSYVAPGTDWFNRMKHVPSAADALTHEAVSLSIPDGGSSTVKHYFYAYPNPTESDTYGGSWSERHTRLVVQANLGGAVCYYPITLPKLENNHCYRVEGLVITGAGSDDPDVPGTRSPIHFSITMNPWTESDHTIEFD